jgi:hypothetical protein
LFGIIVVLYNGLSSSFLKIVEDIERAQVQPTGDGKSVLHAYARE